MVGGANLFLVINVARRDILVGNTGRVRGFVSIVAKSTTSELIIPFIFLASSKPYTRRLVVT